MKGLPTAGFTFMVRLSFLLLVSGRGPLTRVPSSVTDVGEDIGSTKDGTLYALQRKNGIEHVCRPQIERGWNDESSITGCRRVLAYPLGPVEDRQRPVDTYRA